jgi:fructose-1,6-bisphosphatase/inositol monophosphatase family enzyme
MPDVMQVVPDLLREAAAAVVLPVFGRSEAEPTQKSPGEWVTSADRAAEAILTPALAGLVPGSVVIGEEAASADPGLLPRLIEADDVWLLDPLDGTANFAAGRSPFAMMTALQHHGQTVAGWILEPQSGRLAAAQRGAGAWVDGTRLTAAADVPELARIRGAASRRFLPPALAEHLRLAEAEFAALSRGTGCAGADYPAIASAERDFALFWRTLPWDHAPGVLFAIEAGAMAARLDGGQYLTREHGRPGLLVARNAGIWQRVADRLGAA